VHSSLQKLNLSHVKKGTKWVGRPAGNSVLVGIEVMMDGVRTSECLV